MNSFTALCFILLCIISKSIHADHYKVTKSDISFFIEIKRTSLNIALDLLIKEINKNTDFMVEEITSNDVTEIQEQPVYHISGLNNVGSTTISRYLNFIYQRLSHPNFHHIPSASTSASAENNSNTLRVNIRVNAPSSMTLSNLMTRAAEIAEQQVNNGAFTRWHPELGAMLPDGSQIISLVLTASLQSTAAPNGAGQITPLSPDTIDRTMNAFSQAIPWNPISYFSVTTVNNHSTQRIPEAGLNYILPAHEALNSTQKQALTRSIYREVTPGDTYIKFERFVIAHTFQNTEESFGQMLSGMEVLRSNLISTRHHFILNPFNFSFSSDNSQLTIYFMLDHYIPSNRMHITLSTQNIESIIPPTGNIEINPLRRTIYVSVTHPPLHQEGVVMELMTFLVNKITTAFAFIVQIAANLIRQPPSSEEELTEVIAANPQPEENSPNETSTEHPPQQQTPVIFINSDKASQ
ncbi:hypothetical protein NX722_06805 [Endozoicomonas gorgoniicola]|uniref:Uncharacterized protein n=1 Tax=Endozoicomonas gorgoniicola TaxID=1234144 RepID=A0ABT3MTE7_9GAMM|nr:hypothetical protein [Endozoicomonas gorgoniicola]MCW7552358.1 hypothetical protein [Endozoicomonas gorgoniicola]